MKTKLILRTMELFILMVSMFVLFSCSKKAQENISKDSKEQQDKKLEVSSIAEKDFAESDEDLLTVDYKVFYDQLAPHGEWVQVTPEEIGLKSKIAQTESSGNSNLTLSKLLGINDAYASDLSVGMVYVWKPSADLAIMASTGETPVYVPYTNGQWVNTNDGWYFRGATPVEETTSHYGRWVNSPNAGWMWVPGRVWAPAWVDWRQNDTYVSWAPLPPSGYLVDGNMSTTVIDDNNYVSVNRNYFLEPAVYKYTDVYYDNGDRILVSQMSIIPGLSIVNSVVVNRGPDVSLFQIAYGRNIDLVNIQYVRNFNEVRYSDNAYYVYTPVFQRFKHHDNERWSISEPKSYKKYGDWKEIKNEEKEYRKENKGNDNENKYYDNGNKNKGYDNGNRNKGNDNGNKNKYNDNGNKNKYNDNGNKNKGNDNGNKNKGNDNGNKNKGNDNGNKNKGNDNGNKGNDNGNKNKGNDNGNKNKGNDNGNKNKGNDNGNKNKGNDNGNKGNDNGNKGKNK